MQRLDAKLSHDVDRALVCSGIAQRPHAYGMQNIVSGEVRGVHVARMRFYADAALAITAELKDFSTRFHARTV